MKTLILTLLIANALFWGLFPHNAHCLFVDNIINPLSIMLADINK